MPRAKVTGSAADFIPPNPTLDRLRAAAAGCRGCELYLDATQTVFGEGRVSADLMFVGEQPGDQEDRVGRPFVGPAGRMLDEALEAAGIARDTVYVTNAVKHFRFVRNELIKRRLHKKPSAGQVRACNPWLREELKLLQPKLVVALGSTAAQALLGTAFKVTQHRGEVVSSAWAGPVLATVHPSSILRAPAEYRADAKREFFEDVGKAAVYLRSRSAAGATRPTARSDKRLTPASTRPASSSVRAERSSRSPDRSSRAKRGT
ncbi:MAG TPA: UdgX family uracil-DNA binding protein [Gemmatimonadales bacterium]|jgi:DNA polymerase